MKWFFSALVVLIPIFIGIEANIKLTEKWYYVHQLTTFWIGLALLITYGFFRLAKYIRNIVDENKKELQSIRNELANVNHMSQDFNIPEEKNKELNTNKDVMKDSVDKTELTEDKVKEEVPKSKVDNLIEAWINKDKGRMKIVFEELQNRETLSSEKIINECFYYGLLYQIGEDSTRNFEAIENRAEGTEVYGRVMNIIAKAYESTHNYEAAKLYYEKGLEIGTNNDNNGYLIRGLAHSHYMSGNKKESYRLLISTLNSTKEQEERYEYLKKLAEQYKKDNKFDSQISALEKALEIKPNDKSLLFDIAYAYAENKQDNLALLHYKSIINIDPTDKEALNNLGVAYGKLKLHFNEVKSYKKAFELDNTLAASNLALIYKRAGFEGEARSVLEQANSQEIVHEFVGRTLVALQEELKQETEEELKKLQEAQVERIFQRKLATAEFDIISDKEPSVLQMGNWIMDGKHESEIEIQDKTVIINWTKFSKKYKLEGEINNRYLSLNYYEMDYQFPYLAKEEKGFINKGTAIGYIEKSKMQIRINENNKLVYYTFLKVDE